MANQKQSSQFAPVLGVLFFSKLKIYLFLIFFFCPFFLLQAKPKKIRFDLGQCVQAALKYNDQILATNYSITKAYARKQEAHPKGIPVIKYKNRMAPVPRDLDDPYNSFVDGQITLFNNLKIELGSVISTFGKISTAQDLAGIGIYAEELKAQQKTDDIILKVHKLYHGIVLARELLSLAGKANNTLKAKIRELETARIVDQLQVLKLKFALYEIERKVEEARQKHEIALATLKFLVGVDQNQPFDIKTRSLLPTRFQIRSFNSFLQLSKKHQPEYRLLDQGLKANELKLKLEQKKYLPNLGWGGFVDYGFAPGVEGDERENTFTNPFNFTRLGVGIELSGEFDWVKTNAKIKQAKADLLKTVYEKRAANRGLELDLKKAYLELKRARSLMIKAKAEKKAAKQMVFLTKSNLDLGIGEKKDHLEAIQSYLLFQGRHLEAVFNFNVAVAEMQKRTGGLVPQFRGHQ